eukprot:jgi/Mesvir1/26484/Mv16153-RA.1
MGDSDLDRLQIVGKCMVGSLIYVCGKMPEGTNRCWFQWERLRNNLPASASSGAPAKWEKIPGENTPQYTPVDEDSGCEVRVLLAPILDNRTLGKIVAVPAGKVLTPTVKLTDDHNSKEKVRHALAYALQQKVDSSSDRPQAPNSVSGDAIKESAQQHPPAVFRSVGQKETPEEAPISFSRAEQEAQERARQGLASLMMQRPAPQVPTGGAVNLKPVASTPAPTQENPSGSFVKPALRPVDARVDPAAARAAASASGQVPATTGLRPVSGGGNNNASTPAASTTPNVGIARTTSGSGSGSITAKQVAPVVTHPLPTQDAPPGSFVKPVLRSVDARVDPAAARAAASASGQLSSDKATTVAPSATVGAAASPPNPVTNASIARSSSGGGSGNVTAAVNRPFVPIVANASATQDAPPGSFIKPALRPVDARVDPAAARAAASASGQLAAKNAAVSNAGGPSTTGSSGDSASSDTNSSAQGASANAAPTWSTTTGSASTPARTTSGPSEPALRPKSPSPTDAATAAVITAAFAGGPPKSSRPRIPETLVPSVPARSKVEVSMVGSEDVDPWRDGEFLDSEAVGIPSKRFTTLRVPRP